MSTSTNSWTMIIETSQQSKTTVLRMNKDHNFYWRRFTRKTFVLVVHLNKKNWPLLSKQCDIHAWTVTIEVPDSSQWSSQHEPGCGCKSTNACVYKKAVKHESIYGYSRSIIGQKIYCLMEKSKEKCFRRLVVHDITNVQYESYIPNAERPAQSTWNWENKRIPCCMSFSSASLVKVGRKFFIASSVAFAFVEAAAFSMRRCKWASLEADRRQKIHPVMFTIFTIWVARGKKLSITYLGIAWSNRKFLINYFTSAHLKGRIILTRYTHTIILLINDN